MTNRRHPAAAFWLTVTLVVVLVGYQLSFGPACWAIDRGWIGYEYPRIVYWPIGKTFRPLPSPFQRAILWVG